MSYDPQEKERKKKRSFNISSTISHYFFWFIFFLRVTSMQMTYRSTRYESCLKISLISHMLRLRVLKKPTPFCWLRRLNNTIFRRSTIIHILIQSLYVYFHNTFQRHERRNFYICFFTFYIKRRISIIIFSFYFFLQSRAYTLYNAAFKRRWSQMVFWFMLKEGKNGATCSSNTKFKYCLFQCHGFVFSFIYVWVY